MTKINMAIFFGSALLTAHVAFASGLQISPSRLDIAAAGGKDAYGEMVVANPTPDVQLFRISADDFGDAIKFSPESFTLESGARKTVKIAASAAALAKSGGQTFATNVSIVGQPLAQNSLSVNAAVKIPLTVRTNTRQGKKIDLQSAGILAGFLSILIALAAIKRHTKKTAP